MKKYPFKFLNSYSKEDKGIFFGRDEEINALYELVFQSPIVIVYGTSGTGKTSLINCGLAGKFQPHDWLPLMVRRGNNINDSLEKVLLDAGGNTSAFTAASNWLDEWSDDPGSVTTDLSPAGKSIKALFQKTFKPVYLIFDQFEELYVLGTKAEQELFIRTIKEFLSIQQPLKIILSIREEFLGYLYEFEKEVPQLLNKKLRVESMNLDKVKDVIRGINDYDLSMVKIEKDETNAFTEEIFERLKGKEKTLTIQLPYLQVFLDKLYTIKTNDENHQTDATFSMEDLKKIGDIDDVLQNFLEEQVMHISRKLSTAKSIVTSETIWKMLSNFCTLEGTKEPISKKELEIRLKDDLKKKLIDQSFDEFVKSRILNKFEDEDLYELTHDALALKIAEKRSEDDISVLEVIRLIKSKVALKAEFREYFTEKQLNFIEPYLSKIGSELSVEEQKLIKDSQKILYKNRRTRKFWQAAIIGLIFLGLLISGFFGNKRIIKLELLNDVKEIEAQITAANSNIRSAKDNEDKAPTLSLQLVREALSLISANKIKIDSLAGKSYLLNNPLKKEKHKKLVQSNRIADSLARVYGDSLLKNDYALYKNAKLKNPEQAIFDIRFVNGIFLDTNDVIKVWNAPQSLLDTIEQHGRLAQLVFPEDANEAMALYKDGTAHYWGTKDYYGKLELNKDDKITSIAVIHYDVIGFKMLSALNNEKIVEWNLNGTIRESNDVPVIYKKSDVDFKDSVVSIAISPNRSRIFTASDKGMGIIWPADTSNVELLTIKKIVFNLHHQDTIICSAFSNNGLMIITGSKDRTAKIWRADNGELIKTLRGHSGPITSVAFSVHDNIVYTGSLDKTFRQWRLPPMDSIFSKDRFQWNQTLSFDDLFEMNIIDSIPKMNANKNTENEKIKN
jgi:WD40 repeat protein